MSTPSHDVTQDNHHGRVARIVSISLVSLYALVALGWAATAQDAPAASTTPPAVESVSAG